MLNLLEVEEIILQHFEATVPQKVIEQSMPDAATAPRDAKGNIVSYVAFEFGDPQYLSDGRGLAGTRYDDYELPIKIQAVSSTPKKARQIAHGNILSSLLGMSFPWTGQIRKRPGGMMWNLTSSNGATEAYVASVSFAITVQMSD